MKRITTGIAVFFIVAGLTVSGWNLYDWWKSRQSVHESEAHSKEDVKANGKQRQGPVHQQEHRHQMNRVTAEDFSTLKINEKTGNEVAKLIIPGLEMTYDVFWGTDEGALKRGVGMYVSRWTTVPNPVGGHTVLSGHRDTVFTKLGDLEEGDTLKMKYRGETSSYRIKKIWITDPDDRSVIVKKEDPTLTLTTCYPFNYIGTAPKRYIVQADRVERGQK